MSQKQDQIINYALGAQNSFASGMIQNGSGFAPSYSRFGSENPMKNILWAEAYTHMFDVASSLFTWEGLDTLFEGATDTPYGDLGTWIEKAILNQYGMLVVFKDDSGSPQIAIASPANTSFKNYYYQWDSVIPVMPGGALYHKPIKLTGPDAEGVLIENKQYAGPTDPAIMDIEATFISELRLSQMQNLQAIRNPTVIYSTKWNKEDATALETAIKEGQPIVKMSLNDPKADLDVTKAPLTAGSINANVPYNYNIMDQSLATLYSSAFNKLGVKAGVGMEKAERLISSEADSNDAMADGVLSNKLKSRQYSAKKINEIFGSNVSVRVNEAHVDDDTDPSEMLKNGASFNNKAAESNEGGDNNE